MDIFSATIMPESNDIPKDFLLKKFTELHEFHVQNNHADAWFKGSTQMFVFAAADCTADCTLLLKQVPMYLSCLQHIRAWGSRSL